MDKNERLVFGGLLLFFMVISYLYFNQTNNSPYESKPKYYQDGSENVDDFKKNNLNSYKTESINGNYSYEDNSVKLSFVITDNYWNGKTMFISGYGSVYDNQNAIYDNGVVRGNDIFESTGMSKIGYVSDQYLYTTVGGRAVTLRKQ